MQQVTWPFLEYIRIDLFVHNVSSLMNMVVLKASGKVPVDQYWSWEYPCFSLILHYQCQAQVAVALATPARSSGIHHSLQNRQSSRLMSKDPDEIDG